VSGSNDQGRRTAEKLPPDPALTPKPADPTDGALVTRPEPIQVIEPPTATVPAEANEPVAQHDEEDRRSRTERFFKDFASTEARQILRNARWLLYAAVAGIGFEFLASKLKGVREVEFAAKLFGWLADLVVACDFAVFALFAVVTAILASVSLLRLIGIDIPAILLWVWNAIKGLFGY